MTVRGQSYRHADTTYLGYQIHRERHRSAPWLQERNRWIGVAPDGTHLPPEWSLKTLKSVIRTHFLCEKRTKGAR